VRRYRPRTGIIVYVVTDVLLPLALAVIMVSLGLSLTIEDFRRVLTSPKGVAIGLANLLVLSPLLAFGSAELYDLGALFAVGLVIMGAAPGGVMANLLTHVARGETALSVTMTAVSSVVAVFTVPLYLKLAVDWFDAGIGADVSMLGTVARVFAITLIPLAIGMAIRARRPERAIALGPRVKRVSLSVFVLVVIGAVASEWDRVTESFATVAPAALTLNVAAMALSFLISRAARLPDRSATAISMELGLHNSTLTIAVATTIDTRLAIPAAVYSAFMFLTAVPFALLMARRNGPLPAPAVA
jgi:BASS family bile acid:Na+ symporter